jgi:hypothetical protein
MLQRGAICCNAAVLQKALKVPREYSCEYSGAAHRVSSRNDTNCSCASSASSPQSNSTIACSVRTQRALVRGVRSGVLRGGTQGEIDGYLWSTHTELGAPQEVQSRHRGAVCVRRGAVGFGGPSCLLCFGAQPGACLFVWARRLRVCVCFCLFARRPRSGRGRYVDERVRREPQVLLRQPREVPAKGRYSRGTHGVLTGCSRGAHGGLTGYSRGTHGYSRGTHGYSRVLTGDSRGTHGVFR